MKLRCTKLHWLDSLGRGAQCCHNEDHQLDCLFADGSTFGLGVPLGGGSGLKAAQAQTAQQTASQLDRDVYDALCFTYGGNTATKPAAKPKCECGVAKVGGIHSSWCPVSA